MAELAALASKAAGGVGATAKALGQAGAAVASGLDAFGADLGIGAGEATIKGGAAAAEAGAASFGERLGQLGAFIKENPVKAFSAVKTGGPFALLDTAGVFSSPEERDAVSKSLPQSGGVASEGGEQSSALRSIARTVLRPSSAQSLGGGGADEGAIFRDAGGGFPPGGGAPLGGGAGGGVSRLSASPPAPIAGSLAPRGSSVLDPALRGQLTAGAEDTELAQRIAGTVPARFETPLFTNPGAGASARAISEAKRRFGLSEEQFTPEATNPLGRLARGLLDTHPRLRGLVGRGAAAEFADVPVEEIVNDPALFRKWQGLTEQEKAIVLATSSEQLTEAMSLPPAQFNRLFPKRDIRSTSAGLVESPTRDIGGNPPQGGGVGSVSPGGSLIFDSGEPTEFVDPATGSLVMLTPRQAQPYVNSGALQVAPKNPEESALYYDNVTGKNIALKAGEYAAFDAVTRQRFTPPPEHEPKPVIGPEGERFATRAEIAARGTEFRRPPLRSEVTTREARDRDVNAALGASTAARLLSQVRELPRRGLGLAGSAARGIGALVRQVPGATEEERRAQGEAVTSALAGGRLNEGQLELMKIELQSMGFKARAFLAGDAGKRMSEGERELILDSVGTLSSPLTDKVKAEQAILAIWLFNTTAEEVTRFVSGQPLIYPVRTREETASTLERLTDGEGFTSSDARRLVVRLRAIPELRGDAPAG